MAQYCPMCKARIEGNYAAAEDGCQKLFERVLALEYSDAVYGGAHLLTVDCYALQHSEIHRPNSNAFHLLRLGWTLNRVRVPKLGQTDNDFKRYAVDLRSFPYLEAPKNRGKITVVDVAETVEPKDHMKAVCVWAGAVWRAYGAHHPWVRKKLDLDF